MERVSGLRFVVVGAGRSGLALTRFLLDRGGEVVLTDNRSEGLDPEVREMGRRGARLDLGGHDEAAFTRADRVLVSPGVPLTLPALESARRAGVTVWGEIEFASRFLKGRIIGITGTNGKSTTTTLTGLLLSGGGLDAVACGNLGTPLIEMAPADAPSRHYVVELSSFQLEAIETFRPHVAALLNVAPDHQDRYASHADYREAKGRIFENQRPEDRALLNRDDAETLEFAGGIAAGISFFSRLEKVEDGACVEGGRVVIRNAGRSREVLPVDQVPLVGVHNLENVLASVAAADLCGVASRSMASAIRRFRGLPHRIELVAENDSVRYYDDSKATNVAATAKSLAGFPGGVILILGGKDKGGDFASLVPLIRERAAGLVFMGKARDSIRAQVGEPVPARTVVTMAEAVAAAKEMAAPGQVVLLAPGCASFDAYRNYEERGEDFRRKVLSLAGGAPAPGGGR
jgi:UDP-N-acetylmuramoylalanine--D-glutamate ligase